MLICPYLFHTQSAGAGFFSRRGYPYVVAGVTGEWPIIRGSPQQIAIYLADHEVYVEDGDLVAYLAIIGGELSIVSRESRDAQSISVKFVPETDETPTNFLIELNLADLGARTFEPELSLEQVDPLTGVLHGPFDGQSSRELPWVVSHALDLRDTEIGTEMWCLVRASRYSRPEWVAAFRQQHARLPDDVEWLTRVFDKFELSPGLRGPRVHCRYFESITSERACAFGLHAENLSWWRTLRSASEQLFRVPAQGPIETHVITSWHLARDALVQRLGELGLRPIELQIAASEEIQGCMWDGVALGVEWDGRKESNP